MAACGRLILSSAFLFIILFCGTFCCHVSYHISTIRYGLSNPINLGSRKFIVGFFKSRLGRYSNSESTFQLYRIKLSGDISTNPGPQVQSSSHPCFEIKAKGLKVCHLNIRSLPCHYEETNLTVLANKFDLFAISETWLNPIYNDSELYIPDYQLHRCDRDYSSRGGGTAIYVKNTLLCNRIYPLENINSLEYVCLEIRQHHSGQRLLFIVIYRPPNSHADLYSHIEQLLESTLCLCNEIIVVGF